MKRIIYIVLIVVLLPLNFGCSKHYEFELEDDLSGTHKGHDYVDLGLSVKWATCNVGADSPEEYGNYYAWGEINTKSRYTVDNCGTWEKNIGDIKGTSRDVAHQKWGGNWRIPTVEEFQELVDKCDWDWDGDGYIVTGPNGNSIFLPAAGFRDEGELYCDGSYGTYWSSTPHSENSQGAFYLTFDSGIQGTYWCERFYGLSVRPVL